MCIDISFFNIMDVHDNIMDVVTLIMVQVQSIRLDTIYLICLLKFTISYCSSLKHSKQKHKLLHSTQIEDSHCARKQEAKMKQYKILTA